MHIVCPSCASEYAIDPERLGETGQTVRCANCRATWFVKPPAVPARLDGVRTDEAVAAGPEAPAFAVQETPHVRRRPLRGPPARPAAPRPVLAQAAVGLAAAILLATPLAFAFRTALVGSIPATATLFSTLGAPVNLVGLTLADVTSARDGNVLFVEGALRNDSESERAAPRLDLQILGAAGEELYRWTAAPPQAALAAGASVPFRLRLASPPPAGREVVVTFERPRDARTVASR